jgi:hypothetical protein
LRRQVSILHQVVLQHTRTAQYRATNYCRIHGMFVSSLYQKMHAHIWGFRSERNKSSF